MEKHVGSVGGMASGVKARSDFIAWEDKGSNKKNASAVHFRYDSGIQSLQKRGASRTHIPGDLSKPPFLKRALAFIHDELRILGALQYVYLKLIELAILQGRLGDFKYMGKFLVLEKKSYI